MHKITIHCIRHAQGYHNLSTANHTLPDPSLTPLGEAQCAELSRSFPFTNKITHLVASPLRRTIYTTLLTFPSLVQKGEKVLALPELQETSDLPCDTGSNKEKLEKEFADETVDLHLLTPDWNSKEGKWSPASSAIEARAMKARKFLRELGRSYEGAKEEVHIVVTTHGGFLHYFTEDWEENAKFTGTGWENTEWRSYEFVGERSVEQGGDGASLKETSESRERRRGKESELTADEQRELRASAEREWTESGYTSTGWEKGESGPEGAAKL